MAMPPALAKALATRKAAARLDGKTAPATGKSVLADATEKQEITVKLKGLLDDVSGYTDGNPDQDIAAKLRDLLDDFTGDADKNDPAERRTDTGGQAPANPTITITAR